MSDSGSEASEKEVVESESESEESESDSEEYVDKVMSISAHSSKKKADSPKSSKSGYSSKISFNSSI